MNKIEKIVEGTSGEVRELLDELVGSLATSIKKERILQQQVEYVNYENRLLKKKMFGASSEKFGDGVKHQEEADIFDEFELCASSVDIEDLPTDTTPDNKPATKKPGRKSLPKDLPRKIVTHDLTDNEKTCDCGCQMSCIGETSSEELGYQPPKLWVEEHRCKKYACADCTAKNKKNPDSKARLKTAKKPKQLIPKSIATPALLAAITANKFCDHLPLYRQESIFKRSMVALSRQTMSEWMLKVSDAVIPLINLLQESVLEYDVAFADETTLQVLNKPKRRAQSKSYMWCFQGGPPDQRAIIYQYHATRGSEVAKTFFEGYQGGVHCDGYHGYNLVLATEGVVGINCLAHVRRKFFEALPNVKEKGVSGHVVRTIRSLYHIEAALKEAGACVEAIKAMRQSKAKPILDELKIYLDEKSKTVLPKRPVGKAISYTLKRWPFLITYLEDGRYEIDNNRSERSIKPFVIGRKNWLFANTVHGAHASARLFSLIESAKANEFEPHKYLEYIFRELPNCVNVEDYEALLPWNVKTKLAVLSNVTA